MKRFSYANYYSARASRDNDRFKSYIDTDIPSMYDFFDRFNTKCVRHSRIIDKVIFNNPATIVIWSDGSKTVVKCRNEDFDPEKGLSMAVCKKVFGSEYYKLFKRFLPKDAIEQCKQSKTEIEYDLERAFREYAESYCKAVTAVRQYISNTSHVQH